MNKRRLAREVCFKFFFHFQLPIFEKPITDINFENIQSEFYDFCADLELDQKEFAYKNIESTLKNKDQIISICYKMLKNWKFERLSKVDQTILLLYSNELLHFPNVPKGIVINEAIELAKKFGTENSAKFINATLDKITLK